MIAYTLIMVAIVLLVGVTIHLLYKYIFRRGKYRGLTFFEGMIILISSIPGLAGCASGSIGFAFPLPLIMGLPLHLLFLDNKKCGWLMVSNLYFLMVWIVSNLIVLVLLYFYKIRTR